MPSATTFIAFELVAFGMVLTPGANLYIPSASDHAGIHRTQPDWATVQRWMMGTVLAGLAIRMMTEARR